MNKPDKRDTAPARADASADSGTNWTQGPWKFDGVDTVSAPLANADVATLIAVRDPNYTHGGKYNTDAMEASARLIAAAPDLYASGLALFNVAADIREAYIDTRGTESEPGWLTDLIDAARTLNAALAKARGEV